MLRSPDSRLQSKYPIVKLELASEKTFYRLRSVFEYLNEPFPDGLFFNFFQLSAQALWRVVGSSEHVSLHDSAARLLTLVHARRANEPSSEAESIILSSLTQTHQVGLWALVF